MGLRGLVIKQLERSDMEYRCWNCGHNVVWVGDFMESEIEGLDEYPDKDRVVGLYHCPECGSDFEFRQGRKED